MKAYTGAGKKKLSVSSGEEMWREATPSPPLAEDNLFASKKKKKAKPTPQVESMTYEQHRQQSSSSSSQSMIRDAMDKALREAKRTAVVVSYKDTMEVEEPQRWPGVSAAAAEADRIAHQKEEKHWVIPEDYQDPKWYRAETGVNQELLKRESAAAAAAPKKKAPSKPIMTTGTKAVKEVQQAAVTSKKKDSYHQWTAEEAAKRDNEVDPEENSYSFSHQRERIVVMPQPPKGKLANDDDAVIGFAGNVAFSEGKHAYYVPVKGTKDHIRVLMSASKLKDYYHANAQYKDDGGFAPHPTYVKRIEAKLPQSVLIFLCSFYTDVVLTDDTARWSMTYTDRITIFEDVIKQMPKTTDYSGNLKPYVELEYIDPFPLVGGGVWDMLEEWLMNGPKAVDMEPKLSPKVADPSPLYNLYLFLSEWFWRKEHGDFRQVIRENCMPLYRLMEIQKNATEMLHQLLGHTEKDRPDNYGLARKFGSYAAPIGSAGHLYLEMRIKNGSADAYEEYPSLLIGKGIKAVCERIVRVVVDSKILGTYQPHLSEVAFVMLKYMTGCKSDYIGFNEVTKEYMVADFKFSRVFLESALKLAAELGVRVQVDKRTGMHMLDFSNITVAKGSDLWKFAFQMSTYRKGGLMNSLRPFSFTASLIAVAESYAPGYLVVRMKMDTIKTALERGGPELTAPQHVDKALQLRLYWLVWMQEEHERTGQFIDEREFTESGGKMRELL